MFLITMCVFHWHVYNCKGADPRRINGIVREVTLYEKLYQLVFTAVQVTGLAEIGPTVCSFCPHNLQLCSDSIWCRVLLHRHPEFMNELCMSHSSQTCRENVTHRMKGSISVPMETQQLCKLTILESSKSRLFPVLN
jgi:hypothetical protein